MSKHTESPWITRKAVDGSGDIAIIAISTGSIVAECFTAIRYSTERVEEECEANAAIVAAAPETTKALADLLKLFEDIDGGEHDDEPQFVAARAALVKAGVHE